MNILKEYQIIDLFSGLGGFSEGFRLNGCNVIRIDNDPRFKEVPGTIIADIFDLDLSILPKRPDFLLMSPPCNCFSVASVSDHWTPGLVNMPKESAKFAIKLVRKALEIKEILKPRFWLLENPRGMLRTVLGLPQIETFFCSWLTPQLRVKESFIEFDIPEISILNPVQVTIDTDFEIILPPKKATDFWGLSPTTMDWRPLIEDSWEKAPRGTRLGIQRISDPAERAKIPYELSEALYVALFEHDDLEFEDPQDFTIPFYEQTQLAFT